MPLSVGMNLRVTGHCNQGGRKYMEDMFSVAYQQTADGKDLKYAFFGIFDGHGGGEAATFAKEHLMDQIVKQKSFWSDKDDEVLRAIHDGYVNTHYAMWRELDKWPRTASGLPSTAGTTASVAFIRKGKIYIGHVGDSGIILGYQQDGDPQWKARALTRDHKPESDPEITRIQESGGKVVCKSGVPRVVWNRPRIGHKGPVRRSTHIDEIPFLAVARSLGDLWSYNSELNRFVVSPEPDVGVVVVDVKAHRCLIFGTDGLWNMLNPQAAVSIVQAAERHNEKHLIASQQTGNEQADVHMWINPSKSLVDRALERWSSTRLRADNTSVVTLMLDPPGPSRTEVLLSQKKEHVPLPRGTARPVFLAPAPVTSEEPPQKPTPSHSPPEPDLAKPQPLVPSGTFVNDPEEDPENLDSKQPDSSNSSVDSRKVTEVANILHRERLAAGKLTDSEQHPANPKTLPVKAIEKCHQPRQPSLQRELRSRESIQVAEVSSSDSVESTSKPEPVCMIKMNKVHKTKESNGLNLQTFARQISKPKRHSDHKSKEDPGNLTTSIVRQNAFSGSCDQLKSPSPSSLNMGMKRRHSSIVQTTEEAEPCMKRRTRSEDQRVLPPTDENVPANQEKNHTRLSWPDKWEVSTNTRRPVPQRRSLEKKATPVKTIRRHSINGNCSRAQLRCSFGLQRDKIAAMGPTDSPTQRWLRSDTIAATPIKTLRSRNVDIMGHTVPPQMASQYGIVKPNRLSLPARLKHATSTTASSPGTAGTAMVKRAKTPYNPDSRLLSTRSRIKRLGK